MGKLEGVSIDLAFFAKSIVDYKSDPANIKKIYSSVKKELFDNFEIFEFIQYTIRIFGRTPSFEEVKEKFSIDLSQVEIDQRPIEYYLQEIKDRYLKRGILRFVQSFNGQNIGSAKVADIYRPIIRLSEEFKEITAGETHVKNVSDLSEEVKMVVDAAVSGNQLGLSTPWKTFSDASGGMWPGEYTIIAGRPGTGKTWMLYKWAYYLAKLNKRVLLFNTEMSGVSTILRIACLETDIRVKSVRNRTLTYGEAEVLKNKIDEIKKLTGFIITDVGFSPSLSNIEKIIKEQKPDISFIDSMNLIKADSTTTRTDNAAAVSDALKDLAASLGCPIVGATQHNREAVKGAPSLATLALTDANAWNASFVLSIDPPMAEADGEFVDGTLKVHLIKNREGDLATFYVDRRTYEETDKASFQVFGKRVVL